MEETVLEPLATESSAWSEGFNAALSYAQTLWAEQSVLVLIGLIVAGGCSLMALIALARRIRARLEDPAIARPDRILRDLVALHRLTGGEVRTLKRLASARQASHPLEIFVRPDWFTAGDSPSESEAIAVLKRKLFA